MHVPPYMMVQMKRGKHIYCEHAASMLRVDAKTLVRCIVWAQSLIELCLLPASYPIDAETGHDASKHESLPSTTSHVDTTTVAQWEG